ncbi:hypothetical protein [Rhodococcus sp. NPDC060176]|uniref:hypothetical protein n=1 Tax=Rhodococcus sp. NPDC060176 TaxID=3347062 RepID=UPI0036499110
MTVIRVTKVKSKGLPTNYSGTSDVVEYTIKLRSWENVVDRPTEAEVRPETLPAEVRNQLEDWLNGN